MVKITTDTTSMYTVAEGKAMGIDLVPMTLIAGEKSYREIEEINVDELKVLIEEGVKLTTSQPAVGEVMDLFEEASEESPILHITMGANFSGAYSSACAVKEMMDDDVKDFAVLGFHRNELLVGILVKQKVTGCCKSHFRKAISGFHFRWVSDNRNGFFRNGRFRGHGGFFRDVLAGSGILRTGKDSGSKVHYQKQCHQKQTDGTFMLHVSHPPGFLFSGSATAGPAVPE